MNSNVPILKKFSWYSLIPQGSVLLFLSIIAYFIGLNRFLSFYGLIANLMWGAFGQILLWYLIRGFVAKNHKHGMDLVKQDKYAEAIPYFFDSYKIFTKYSWIDKYRYFLISTSKMSFREMDLNNIAFCYGQIGDKENSIKYYKQTLDEFPDSGLAKAALRFTDTLQNEKISAD